MPVYKDEERKTWFVKCRVRNYKGESKQIKKRGFATKREAAEWEMQYRLRAEGSTDMTFAEFAELYKEEHFTRIKESTTVTKEVIINSKLIPTFGDMKLIDIGPREVMMWQNDLIRAVDPNTHRPYSKSYLKTIHNQLSAMLNFAVKYYRLPNNPAAIVGNMGTDREVKIDFWTLDEYKAFSKAIMPWPIGFYAFEILYWTGIREGELLALTPSDFDFRNGMISITKTFQHINSHDSITDPKTLKSRRKVKMPDFLMDEVQEYIASLYGIGDNERIFDCTKNYLWRIMEKGCKLSGVKKIRVHDIRHSHVSLLISMGFSAVAIAERLGHESIHVTYRYAHLFPSVQEDMSTRLNDLKGDGLDV